jgi:adenylate cyclase
MAEERTNRRLAAILAADVVGYSRLMGADEAGTLRALKLHREQVFDPAVAAHFGRVVKLIGDGTLVEFASVVDAVKCAVAIQRAIAAEGSGSPITLRIGVNLGDVIVDGDDIYGDGVNVAARLEALAEPGGVCIASIVNESVTGRIDVAFTDGGEVAVKNIQRPIRVWKWHPEKVAAAEPVSAAAEPEIESPPQSIAVLPFNNMSHDPEQEYFSDGITEDIITDLSKIGGLLVIARNSSFAYKGKSPDIRAVGRELGVRSVLEGSIRRAGNRVRITAQLIDATTGGHLWADRYDRDLNDIFAVQDEVTHRIVSALQVALTPREEALLADSPTTNMEAHDLTLRAREILATTITKETVARAQELLERALKLDPNYAEPYSGLAIIQVIAFNNNWTDDPDATIAKADELASKAVALGPNSAYAHIVLATASGFRKDFVRSRKAIQRALEIKPNDAEALFSQGAGKIFSGDISAGLDDIERARRLDPSARTRPLHFLGLANLLLGNYETAVAFFRERIRLDPTTDLSRALLVSALGHLGRIDDAKAEWAALMELNPDYSFPVHRSRMPFVNPSDGDPLDAGLAKAGLLA